MNDEKTRSAYPHRFCGMMSGPEADNNFKPRAVPIPLALDLLDWFESWNIPQKEMFDNLATTHFLSGVSEYQLADIYWSTECMDCSFLASYIARIFCNMSYKDRGQILDTIQEFHSDISAHPDNVRVLRLRFGKFMLFRFAPETEWEDRKREETQE